MDPSRVSILLAAWERSVLPLAACRAALEVEGWDVAAAVTRLDALTPAAAPATGASPKSPQELLSAYKEAARALRDAPEGTLPRSLVWATQPVAGSPVLARWERHRFFVGLPSVRWLTRKDRGHGPRSVGGHLRVQQDPGAPRGRDEALLSHVDARWTLDQLARFSRRTGFRVAVELRGGSGWVDASSCDESLDDACRELLQADAVPRADVAAACEPIELAGAWELLDRLPPSQRRDPGVASHEAALLRTARIVRDVDVTDESHELSALDAALAGARVPDYLVVRATYDASGGAGFSDVVDRLVVEHRGAAIGPAWREVTREEAVATWRAALTTSQAYRASLLHPTAAARLVEVFLAGFASDALFFRNGTDTGYCPILGSTFEQGSAAVDAERVGLLFVGDED